MGLLVALPKPVHGNVRVYLRSGEATVAKNFLHGPKISPTIQQVGCGAMPQGVGPRCGRIAKCLQQDGYNRTDLTWVNAVSSYAQEQSRAARGSYQCRTSPAKPIVDGKGSRMSIGLADPNLSIAAWRAAMIANRVMGRQAYSPYPDTPLVRFS